MENVIEEIDEIIKRLTAIRDKVELHSQQPSPPASRNSTPRGLRTQPEEFYLPILRALKVRPDGSARVRDVQESVAEAMANKLTVRDREQHLAGQQEIVWVRTMAFARLDLVKQGRLDPDSPRGIWKITQLGREYLEQNE